MKAALPLFLLLLGAQQAGRPAQDFALPDTSGKEVRLSSLRGKVVVVDFWASWCEPCLKELPELARLEKEFAGQVVVLPVNIDRERKNALGTIARLRLSLRALLDPAGKVAEQYDPPKMPTSYVLDQKGVVRHVNEGFDGEKDIARLRRQLAALAKGNL